MRHLDPGREGLRRFDSYRKETHPVKAEGEIWLAVSPEDIHLLAEGMALSAPRNQRAMYDFEDDIESRGLIEDMTATEYLEQLKERSSRANALLATLRTLSNSPEALESHSREWR